MRIKTDSLWFGEILRFIANKSQSEKMCIKVSKCEINLSLASKYIHCLLVGIPPETLYFKYNSTTNEAIPFDRTNKILSIMITFMSNEWKMENGKSFLDLDLSDQRFITSIALNCVFLYENEDAESKHIIDEFAELRCNL